MNPDTFGSMLRNYFNYFTEIEEYFVRRRGKNLMVSPLDWCLIELWKENEIPLHVVLRGIDRSFDRAGSRRRVDPTTLYYCHPAIMEAFQEYLEARVGSHASPDREAEADAEDLPREDVIAYLEGLARDLGGRTEEACRLGAERLGALGSELRRAVAFHPADLERELAALYSSLVSELARSLDPDVLKSLQTEVRRELRAYRKRLSKEMYERLREKRRLVKLAEHFDLPEISLLGLGEAIDE
jgi:hypothetical protein